ncbi:hypothetical protein CHGG_07542 [Chaetomium globosum CBS 148.51]|uniref:Major facilitator superfamily (MFS) profile domain-containing protein n=1 Tax=Chaetomium globosum (strain ATCC 6205 / CBS 148.51 / DSM 1962 / NBRC 6347 / NRRL 1970) TaxID=306901 RepID=Q2GWW2_CHAGB|nr:uncharacterized protein CHGG_07542 [Chaetomium globosum CBS 148.51]EAQ86289.1 hypothetical protein CHGG_07542 [Chaetomium globosum CBS 148.51]
MDSAEKTEAHQNEVTGNGPTTMDPQRRIQVEKSLKRKLDTRCSLFILLYILNYLDRNNIAAARLKGLQEDLDLSYNEYATCLSILYVGYILMQVPSNMMINLVSRPSLYIGCSMLLWGLVSTLSGIVTNFGGMVAIRFFLGFVEAAFLPGALLILSKWYTRRELTTRNALLFCVEGAATMFVAILAVFILPDLPHNTRGFSEEERYVAQLRMTEDVGVADSDEPDQGVFTGLIMALKDPKVYLMMFTLTAYVVGLSFNAFFPTLTGTLNFDYVPTLLMSAPPWAFACLVSLINAWHSDRTQDKPSSLQAKQLRRVSSYSTPGSPPPSPAPPAKRAVAIAMINAFSQLGNVAGSYVWDLKDNGFRKSYGIVTAMFGVTILGCFVFKLVLVRMNKQLEEAERPEAVPQAPVDGERDPEKFNKGFRYLV